MVDPRQQKNQEYRKNILDKSAIGARLRHLRKTLLNLTLEQLSEGADCSSQFLSEIERGESKMGLNVAYAISENFMVNLNWLIDGTGDPFQPGAAHKSPGEMSVLREGPPGTAYVTKEQMEQRMREMMLSLKATMLPPDKFRKVTKAGGVDPEMIVNVPLHLDMAAGDPRMTMEKPDRYVTIHPSLLPQGTARENVVAVVVRGRSMEPKLWDQDIAFIDTTIMDAWSFENLICAVRANEDGDENTIKRVLYVGQKMVLLATNPGYPPIIVEETEEMPLGRRIIGRVFGAYHDFTKEKGEDDLPGG